MRFCLSNKCLISHLMWSLHCSCWYDEKKKTWPICELVKVLNYSVLAITVMIGHMQIRAEDTIIVICTRWGQVNVYVIACIDFLRWIYKDDTPSPWSHLLSSEHPSPSTRFVSCCQFRPFFIPHLPIHPWVCFYLLNSWFPFFSLPSRSRFFFIHPRHHALSAWSAS